MDSSKLYLSESDTDHEQNSRLVCVPLEKEKKSQRAGTIIHKYKWFTHFLFWKGY